ncbi:PfkB family carbohydrate kinase [Thiomicrorhabdus aquaedulcis]|uniref:PfkB family carbohydrate kinase n=1 Tax=Thiomicrorhabdus aquaedulcis TaxID=2211106 RepID=UPI001E2EBEAD|nr:PfkB family carbohydrate kinase [Thiomicrorhabdus aquaedulcis]
MAKILGIGNVVLDIVLTVPHHPLEDEEIRATQKQTTSGGNASNSLHVLTQLGHQTALCATLAADGEAKQLLSNLRARKIDTQHIQTFIKGRTPTSFITLNAQNGHRTIVHFRDLPELSFEHFAKIEIEEYDWLHFEGRNLDNLSGMLNIAKTFLSHQPISLEVEKPREGIEALFPQVNLIIFSHHYAKAKGFIDGQSLLNAIKKTVKHANLVCTWGAKGVWYSTPNDSVHHLPAEPVMPIVDTLGAGDTFNAGLIDGLVKEMSLSQAVTHANSLAAKKCRQPGLDNLLLDNHATPLANIKQLSNAKTLVTPAKDGAPSVVLIKFDDTVKAYENNCPHQNVPLNEAFKIDVNPFEKTLKCSVHEAFLI